MFEGDDEGLGLNSGLMVAKPVAHQSNIVAEKCCGMDDFATTRRGVGTHNRRSSLPDVNQKKTVAIIRRNAVSSKTLLVMSPTLSLSPRGDMVAFCHALGGSSISLVSTSPKRPWTISWRAPVGKVKILGWTSGKSLPLLELQRSDQAPAALIQLKKI
jgi:hypothetical protein